MVVPLSCAHLNDALSLLMVSAKSLPDRSTPLSFQPTHMGSRFIRALRVRPAANHESYGQRVTKSEGGLHSLREAGENVIHWLEFTAVIAPATQDSPCDMARLGRHSISLCRWDGTSSGQLTGFWAFHRDVMKFEFEFDNVRTSYIFWQIQNSSNG